MRVDPEAEKPWGTGQETGQHQKGLMEAQAPRVVQRRAGEWGWWMGPVLGWVLR